MSVKICRFQANESEFQKTQRNRTEVDLPSSLGFIDLTSSRAILDMHVDVTDTLGNTMLIPTTFGSGNMVGGAQALIKNTRVVSQTNGLLDEKRNQNVISANISDWYLKSRSKEDAESLIGNSTNENYGIDRISRLPDCPFISYGKPTIMDEPAGPTVTRRAELPVSWNHLDNFSTISQFPIVSCGNLQYNVEFEDQINVVSPATLPSRAPVPAINKQAVGNILNVLTLDKTVSNYWREPRVGDIASLMFHEDATESKNWDTVDSGIDRIIAVETVANKYVVTFLNGFATLNVDADCTDIEVFYYSPAEAIIGHKYIPVAAAMAAGVMGNAANPLIFSLNNTGGLQPRTTVASQNDPYLDGCPWYVGAPVSLTYINNNVASVPNTVDTVITDVYITSDGVNAGGIRVVLADSVAIADGCTAPVLTFRDSTNNIKFAVNWTIDEFYLEPFQITLTAKQQDAAKKALENLEIPYIKQLLVQKNMPTTNVHTEVLQVPAGTVGMSLLTPQNLTLVSGFDNCEQYRWSINGKEQTNQPILVGRADRVGRQIHNQMLKLHFGNLGQTMKKYDAEKDNYVSYGNKETHALYPLIVPNMPVEQIVQITLISNGDAMNAKNLFFVHHMASTLKISGGKVKVMSSLV